MKGLSTCQWEDGQQPDKNALLKKVYDASMVIMVIMMHPANNYKDDQQPHWGFPESIEEGSLSNETVHLFQG